MHRHARGRCEQAGRTAGSLLALVTCLSLLGAPPALGASSPKVGPVPAAGGSQITHEGLLRTPEGVSLNPMAAASGPVAYRKGVVLVGVRPGVSGAQRYAIERSVGAVGARRLGPATRPVRGPGGREPQGQNISPFELWVPEADLPSLVRRLRRSRAIAYAEPNYLQIGDAIPDDPSFSLQWGDSNTGQAIPTQNGEEVLGEALAGTPGADDRALKAWKVTTGSRSIVIGEVDTGIDLNHPDLAANIWSNPGNVLGCPAGTHGYNVLSKNCDPEDEDETFKGHGTHVAGIMGAVGNNGEGVAGMNWQTTILPVKWMHNAAGGETSALIEALQYEVMAKQEGVNVRVVNDSDTFWGTAKSAALENEIETLGANNILFVTAAGNTDNDNDEVAVQRYPCSYDLPNEICVTASNDKDELPSWANYGPHTVQLAAPGVSIYSTMRENGYRYLSGGSMAAPQVSGAAALILSVEPSLSTTALKTDILANVDKLPSLEGRVITGGRLDVCKALPGCEVPPTSAPVNTAPPTVSGTPAPGQTLTAGTGAWSEGPTSYEYQWQRCATGESGCTAIPGAMSQSYVVGSADVGSMLRVSVTASNAVGRSSPAISAPTAVVQAVETFGKTTVGALSDAFAANRKRVSLYAMPTSGSVTALNIYLQPGGASGQQLIEGIVYANSSGKPGALLGKSSQLSFHSTNSPGWYSLSFATPLSLAAGSYWIGVITGASSDVAGFRYESVSGGRDYDTNTYASGPTNPFGSITTDREQASMYATYTP